MGQPAQGPRLTFFCELESAPLVALFEDPGLIETLKGLNAGVSLGILDLSPERANIVRKLGLAGISVTAWLLLPMAQGYWFNLDNAPAAGERYLQFKRWSNEYDLHWEWIGIDIEPDIRELEQVFDKKRRLVPLLLRKVSDRRRLSGARVAYEQLVNQMQADGYKVESYQLPLIVDERKMDSTLLQRTLGLVDISVDREILMTYSSFLRPHGGGVLWSYAREAEHVAVGSTGGGVQVAGLGDVRALTWEELERDLRLAWRWRDDLYIFSLEGCVRHGYLTHLQQMDWSNPVVLPMRSIMLTDLIRRALQWVLWMSKHPLSVVLMFIALKALLRRKRKIRAPVEILGDKSGGDRPLG